MAGGDDRERLARRPGKTYSGWATRDAKYVRRYIRLYRSIYGAVLTAGYPSDSSVADFTFNGCLSHATTVRERNV